MSSYHGIRKGDTVRQRETGRTATVYAYTPGCGNVYVRDNRTGEEFEISPSNWEKVTTPTPAPQVTPEPQPEPVAPVSANGNGHSEDVPAVTVSKTERVISLV